MLSDPWESDATIIAEQEDLRISQMAIYLGLSGLAYMPGGYA